MQGNLGTTIFHPIGTCKKGPAGDPDASWMPDWVCIGVGLRVIDALLMLAIASGITNAPTLERGAKWAKGKT